MRATVKYVEQKFEEFNQKMFAGRLPKIPIELSDAKTFLGLCCSRTHRLPDGRREHSDFRMRINTRLDLPESTVEDTIIHEMIHYFINYNGLTDTSTHGPIFQAIMKSINFTFRRNLTVRYKVNEEQQEEMHDPKPKWHVVAAIRFFNGERGVKVLPRRIPRIYEYYKKIISQPSVEDVILVLSINPFFNRYPTSSSFKYHLIEEKLLEENLHNAGILRVKGTDVITTQEFYP